MKILILISLLFYSGLSFATSKIEGLDIISQTKKTFELKNLKPGFQGTVLIFMSSTCPCSISHAPVIKTLSKEYKDFKFVGMYSFGDKNEVIDYFKSTDLGIPILEDEKHFYADEMRASNTPYALIFNGKGEILYRGGVTSSSTAKSDSIPYLKNALNQIQEKKEVNPTQTRVLGCAIRRS